MQLKRRVMLFSIAILALCLVGCEDQDARSQTSSPAQSQTMVVIGDSFIAGDPGHGLTFRNALQKLFRCESVFNFAVNGTGFVACNPDVGTPPFSIQLQNAANSDEFVNSDVGVVIVFGNTNDSGITDTGVVIDAIDRFDADAREVFPNAAIHYCIGDLRNVNNFTEINRERLYISHLNSIRSVVHDMLGVVSPSYYEANGEHWSDQGCVIAANYIYSGALPPMAGAADIEANDLGAVISDGNTFMGSMGKNQSTGTISIWIDSDIKAGETVGTIANAYVLMQIPDSVSSYDLIGYAQDGTLYHFRALENESGTLDIKSNSDIPLSKENVEIAVSGSIMP